MYIFQMLQRTCDACKNTICERLEAVSVQTNQERFDLCGECGLRVFQVLESYGLVEPTEVEPR